MLLAWFSAAAFAQASVSLAIYVPPEAGSVYDVAADGATGLCTARGVSLTCPAGSGPVRFRWGPEGVWTLVGDRSLEPGFAGVAWVLATDASRAEALRLWSSPEVRPDDVRAWWGEGKPVPSPGMLDRITELSRHPDPAVRTAVADGLRPWISRPTSGLLPAGAPTPISPRLLVDLARDPDPAVRRRVAQALRDQRPELLGPEVGPALLQLTGDPDESVRRAALVALSEAPPAAVLPAELAWQRALRAVEEEGSAGAAAAATLARLADDLEPGPNVDPSLAMERILAQHPERAWRFAWSWRAHLPFRDGWATALLLDTDSLRKDLLVHWSKTAPAEFAAVLVRWDAANGTTERHRLARMWLAGSEDGRVREAVGGT